MRAFANADSSSASPHRWVLPERGPDWLWCPNYEQTYHAKSLKTREVRARRRSLAHERAGAAGKADADAASRAASTRWMINRRLSVGFMWSGGPVAGDSRYHRPAFCEPGLRSEEHPVLRCFVSKLRHARQLLVGDDKAGVFVSDSKLLALDAAYVEDNKICCGVLRIELDSVISRQAIVAECRAKDVPLPNIVVGWEDADGFHHPHLIWLLHDSVPLVGRSNRRFLGLYQRVLRGLTKAFLDVGADPGGLFNSHRHKNPLSPLWHVAIEAEQPYDLSRIAKHVDTAVRKETLEALATSIPKGVPLTLRAHHSDPAVAAGSNSVFRAVAVWARQKVVVVKAEGGSEEEFRSLVEAEACRLIGSISGDSRRGEQAALGMAAKVTAWTWKVYRLPAPPKASLKGQELAVRLAEGGRKAAATRKARSGQGIVAAALNLADAGKRPTQAMVQARSGKGEKTVRRHWSAVQAALAARSPERCPD